MTHRRGRIDRREPITFQDREVFVRQSAIAQDRFTFTVVLLTVAPLQVGAPANKNGERRKGWGLKARLADFGPIAAVLDWLANRAIARPSDRRLRRPGAAACGVSVDSL